MKKISDDRLDKMLTDYCEAPVEPSFSYDPGRVSGKAKAHKPYQRQLMAAAVFVLVGVLGLTAYFLIGNKPSAPIAVKPPAQSPTAAYVPTGAGNTQPPGSTAPTAPTAPTEKATQKPAVVSTQSSTQNTSSTAQPVDQGSPAQTQTSDDVPPADAAAKPTQPVVVPEISTQAPTQPPAPTQAPTQPPKVAPTEAPIDKLPDLAPVGYDGIIIETVPKEDLSEDSVIYCRLRAEDGTALDDGDPYSDQHLAQMFADGGEIMMYYIPCDCTTLPYEGLYRYEFYDDTGKILCGGNEYLRP